MSDELQPPQASSAGSASWVKVIPDVSLGNLLLLLGMLGTLGAGIYEGGRIQQALADGVATESGLREADTRALNLRIDAIASSLGDVKADLRTLTAVVMADHTRARGLP